MSGPNLNQISRQNYYPVHAYEAPNFAKTYSSKTLADPALAGWLEEAQAYYRGVMSGELERPEAYAWQEFLNQFQWAKSYAGSGGEEASWGDAYGPDGEQQEPQVGPFGGELSADGNSWNYDMVATDLGWTGKDSRNNIFGTQNSLNLDMPSAQTSFEMTMDHGVEVLKVIVTTSKGTAVYFYDAQDSADFALNVNMADPTKVTGLDSLPAELQAKIKVEKYDPNKKPEEVITQSSLTGQAVEGEENAFYYEAETADQTIDFRLKKGENETHYTVGNANISFPVSSTADVTEGPFEVNGSTYDFMTIVTHADGSTDTIYTKKPFTVNVNTVEGYTTFNGTVPTDNEISEAFQDIFTLNGEGPEAAEVDSRAVNDTVADDTDKERGTATYNRSGEFENHVNFDDEIKTHYVSTPGPATIHTHSYDDLVIIDKNSDGTVRVTVVKGGGSTMDAADIVKPQEVYLISAASKLVIDALDQNVINQLEAGDMDVEILGDDGPSGTEAAAEWPGTQVETNINTTQNDGHQYDHALGMAREIETALTSEDWQTVKDHLNMDFGADPDLPADQGERNRKLINDMVRKLITGIYKAAGSMDRFMELMNMIDPEVRQLMIDKVTAETGELNEKGTGDQWSSQGTADMIRRSLETSAGE